MDFTDSVILSDSRAALVCIRDRFTHPSVPYIVYSIALLLLLVSSRGLGVHDAWVPAHSGILGNETADYIANSAARLPFTVRPALPFGDLRFAARLPGIVPSSLALLRFSPDRLCIFCRI